MTITTIKELVEEEAYKYLGINESDGIQHTKMKEMSRGKKEKYYRGIRLVLKSEMNSANGIEAIKS